MDWGKRVCEMVFKAENVSRHSGRNGKVPAEDAAQGLQKNFFINIFLKKI